MLARFESDYNLCVRLVPFPRIELDQERSSLKSNCVLRFSKPKWQIFGAPHRPEKFLLTKNSKPRFAFKIDDTVNLRLINATAGLPPSPRAASRRYFCTSSNSRLLCKKSLVVSGESEAVESGASGSIKYVLF